MKRQNKKHFSSFLKGTKNCFRPESVPLSTLNFFFCFHNCFIFWLLLFEFLKKMIDFQVFCFTLAYFHKFRHFRENNFSEKLYFRQAPNLFNALNLKLALICTLLLCAIFLMNSLVMCLVSLIY